MPSASYRTPLGIRTTASLAALALVVSGCETMPKAGATSNNSSATSQYISSCLSGALLGFAAGAVLGKIGLGNDPKKPAVDSKKRNSDLAKAALGGCAIGIAATAIGKILNDRQQAKHEEALQNEARRRALEQQQYEAAVQRTDNMPSRTATERKNRDAERERLKAAYETSVNKPVTVDLGDGATSTIAVQKPAAPQPGASTGAATEGCRVFAQAVSKPPNGDVRQYDTFCPNNSGQFVRVDTQPNPVG